MSINTIPYVLSRTIEEVKDLMTVVNILSSIALLSMIKA